MECIKSSVKSDVYNNKNLPQETIKTTNEKPNLEPKANRNRKAKQKKKKAKLVEGKKS